MSRTGAGGRVWHRAVVAGAVVAMVVSGAALATHVDNMYLTANTPGYCDGGTMGDGFCQTDNATLTVYRQSSLSTSGKANVYTILRDEYAPTDLTVEYPANGVYTGDAETDVIYQATSAVPSGSDGVTWCNDAVTIAECDQHYVAFRYITPIREIVCHETGHAVGLTHGYYASPRLSNTDSSLGCMQTPVPTYDLGAHNTNMINATY